MKRVLKRGGRLILIAPTPDNPCYVTDPTHIRPYNKEDLTQLVAAGGYADIDSFYYPHIHHMYFLPNKLGIPRLAWFFIKTLRDTYSSKREVATTGMNPD
jgi:SAM-dependent methyltransferase